MSSSAPTLIFSQQSADEHIRVWQQGKHRCLDFDDGLLQSEIILDKPDVLPQLLNRAMLAGSMFIDPPKRILLVGAGGGATARYFANRFPNVCGDAVEISPAVASVAKAYFEFPSHNWTLIIADILDYVKDCQQRYDVIIIDIGVTQKTPAWLLTPQFLKHCRALLTKQGYLAFNLLVDDQDSFIQSLGTIRQQYDRRTLCLTLPEYRNLIVMAFNNTPPFSPHEVTTRLADLEHQWGIEFTTFYQQMLNDNPQNSGVF